MFIQQGRHMATTAAGMNLVNALQQPQDSAISHLGPATSREPLPRSTDEGRHVDAHADFKLTPDDKDIRRLHMLKTSLGNEATHSINPRSEGHAILWERTTDPALRSRKSKKGGDIENVGVKAAGRAFAAQRLALSAQPGSSKDPRLTALNHLERRGFKPAPGGLDIPLTGQALGGMRRRRVNALFTPEAASTTEEEYNTQINALREQAAEKITAMNELRAEIAGGNLEPEQIRLRRQAIGRIEEEIANLQHQLSQVAEQARQAARGHR